MLLDLFFLASLTLLLFILTFFFAVIRRDNSIVDIIWGLGQVFLALLGLLSSALSLRQFVLAFLVSLWGTRLAIHIFLRNRGRDEDYRYAKWRRDWGRWWIIRSFFQVYLLQWLLQLMVATPVLSVMLTASPTWTLLDYLGLIIFFLGFSFEALGDWQLARFRANPQNRGQLMTQGLWAWTRHPNYFGEVTLWWGIGLIAFAHTTTPLVFLGPLTITYLILKVSGIPLLEHKYQSRKDWQLYAKKTPAFFPRPPCHK